MPAITFDISPYFIAVGNSKERWILEQIERYQVADDLCRHLEVDDEYIDAVNQKFEEAGLPRRLVWQDGNNQIALVM